MTQAIGKASVWYCDPEDFMDGLSGCGFFGFYKPEFDERVDVRSCPSCELSSPYHKTGDVAEFGIEIREIREDEVS